MPSSTLQLNTDTFVLLDIRKRVHFILKTITNQDPQFEATASIVKYYSKYASKLKKPVSDLGRAELLINDKKQINALFNMFDDKDFNPYEHMNIPQNDISGHLVFSLNTNLYDSLLDESFDEVVYWGTNTVASVKRQIILIMLLLDSLFLTTFYEYGPVGLKAVMDNRLANTGQWWAWMELDNFSSSSYKHAGKLLQTTKNSNLDASINGASALFPTNITYARFSGFLRNSHKELPAYNKLISKFSACNTNDFHLVITDANLKLFSNVLASFRFHAVATYTSRMHMFSNSYVGYINMWRYNNSMLRGMH